MASTETIIPNYVKAKTPQGLREKMLQVQIMMIGKGYTVDFNYIQNVKGEWFAWYVEPFELESLRRGK